MPTKSANVVLDEFHGLIERSGLTLAVAESMTGGELAHALLTLYGSGEWFRGGVVVCDAAIKHDLLGMSAGPIISADAAIEMAEGVARLMDADIGIATTGCSGPESIEAQPVGTLWIGVAAWDHCTSTHHLLDGDPESIRTASIPLTIAAADCSIADVWEAGRHARA
jgi:nicotinamide-nucleotide amidase